MKIVTDENIACVAQAFASLGDIELVRGRGLEPGQVRDADILLVRSVTRVNEALLADSKVCFVGSATTGFDHIDRVYLQRRGIGFANAPGSNANSVAEYIISALMVLAERNQTSLEGKTAGIIGCGNVGSLVQKKLSALGVQCLVNDPPLKEQGGHEDYVDLEALLQADIISSHVPLETGGDHPTFHMLDREFLEQMRPGATLVNTSRGSVVDNTALDQLLGRRSDLTVVLDVWENEPDISTSLLEKVALGTPHIAGYSLEGKLRGTEMLYRAACEYLGSPVQWRADAELPPVQALNLDNFATRDVAGKIRAAVLACYDVAKDDARLRSILSLPHHERSACFDRLRKEYPVRHEFRGKKVTGTNLGKVLLIILRALDFS